MLGKELCQLLGIRYPIFQGGMAWISTAELVAAVSEAGGLGIIGAGHADGQWVREQIREVKQRTDKPFGVNVMLLSVYVEEIMQVVLEEGVCLITTGAGNPGKYIEALKARGIRIFPVVSSVALARRLERLGVDGVIAEGMESGGHVGETTTMALVPQVADAIKLPVVAAGGIADGRGMAAAFALGASGVQMGTRFIVAKECPVHPAYQQAIIRAGDRDTIVTGQSTGHPVRILRNRFARQLTEMEKQGVSREELEKFGQGKYPAAALHGDMDGGSPMAGQVAGLIKQVEPAAEILKSIMQEADQVLKRLWREKA
ncbi:MAG: enoyl-[acyl-carrier-protein] reductase FabK [Syntrophomonadaceae bacterium]|nr:enoyl-[acyl-carrier-protein] reductase FabK [Syntrophomonadaceae bacterium]